MACALQKSIHLTLGHYVTHRAPPPAALRILLISCQQDTHWFVVAALVASPSTGATEVATTTYSGFHLGVPASRFGVREPCSRLRRAKPCFARDQPKA